MFYTLSFVFIVLQRQSIKISSSCERNEFRIQLKIFITISLIVLVHFVTYGIPTILNLIGIVYDFGPEVKIYASVYAGFGSLISSLIIDNNAQEDDSEIKSCAITVLDKLFPCLKGKIMSISNIWVISSSFV